MNPETGRVQSTALLQDRLEAYYHDLVDPAVQIANLTPISDGWETEVYSFDAVWVGQHDPVILRLYPGVKVVERCAHEFRALRGLHANGYPVPRVYYHETDAAVLGKPFLIMERINGRSLRSLMVEDPTRHADWFTRFVQLMVDLHRLDYRAVLGSDEDYDPVAWLTQKLVNDRQVIVGDYGQAWAAPVFDWLDARQSVITPMPAAALHGDFHPNNILITPDEQAYVIDWSGFAGGDYRADLGWTRILLVANGAAAERDALLSEYARLSGHPVEQMPYFEALSALWRLFYFAASLDLGAEALGMRPETVAIMRQRADRFRRVYALLQQHTGLSLPQIESLLASL